MNAPFNNPRLSLDACEVAEGLMFGNEVARFRNETTRVVPHHDHLVQGFGMVIGRQGKASVCLFVAPDRDRAATHGVRDCHNGRANAPSNSAREPDEDEPRVRMKRWTLKP